MPRRSSGLVVCSALLNSMNGQLGPGEFPTAIRGLAARRRPFPKVALDPRGWPERWLVREATGGNGCAVCGHPTSASYCPRCHRLVGGRGTVLREEVLRKAWRPDKDGFVCHYTGVVLDDSGPWGVAFDERGAPWSPRSGWGG